jgi:hypothetical protein
MILPSIDRVRFSKVSLLESEAKKIHFSRKVQLVSKVQMQFSEN